MGHSNSKALNTNEIYQRYFTKKRIDQLNKAFEGFCQGPHISRDSFKTIFKKHYRGVQYEDFADFMFDAFDLNKNGVINFSDFMNILAIATRGTKEMQDIWIFRAFDIDYQSSDEVCDDYSYKWTYEGLKDNLCKLYKMQLSDTEKVDDDQVQQRVASVFQRFDINKNGEIEFEEFRSEMHFDDVVPKLALAVDVDTSIS